MPATPAPWPTWSSRSRAATWCRRSRSRSAASPSFGALETEVADLGEQLAARKAVDRAKAVLQKELDLSEPDAFRWIQKTAMDLRLSMRQVAEGVVEHGVTRA